MKLYLFGPMQGILHSNREVFTVARENLRDMGHDVFCPSEFSHKFNVTDIRECMKVDLAWIIKDAEGLVGLEGWRKSKGALVEVHLAWLLGLPVYEYEFFSRRILREVRSLG
jgi:hypothetical protein